MSHRILTDRYEVWEGVLGSGPEVFLIHRTSQIAETPDSLTHEERTGYRIREDKQLGHILPADLYEQSQSRVRPNEVSHPDAVIITSTRRRALQERKQPKVQSSDATRSASGGITFIK